MKKDQDQTTVERELKLLKVRQVAECSVFLKRCFGLLLCRVASFGVYG